MIDTLADSIYYAYPKLKKPIEARKAILKALKVYQKEQGVSLAEAHEHLLRITTLYAKHWNWLVASGKKDMEFCPYPASWFNAGGHLEDYRSWEMPPEEKPKYPPEEWANANWKPILEAYRIGWGNVMYWGNNWAETWSNLPAAVRSDLTHAWNN